MVSTCICNVLTNIFFPSLVLNTSQQTVNYERSTLLSLSDINYTGYNLKEWNELDSNVISPSQLMKMIRLDYIEIKSVMNGQDILNILLAQFNCTFMLLYMVYKRLISANREVDRN